MDYFGILGEAWKITWRNKGFWVLAGAVSIISAIMSGVMNVATLGMDAGMPTDPEAAGEWLLSSFPLLAGAIAVSFIVWAVMVVVSVAVQGGLTFGANAAAGGRATSIGESFREGFRRWGRVFMTGFVVYVPLFVVMSVLITVVVLLMGVTASGLDDSEAGIIGVMCCGLPIVLVVVLAASAISDIVVRLGICYGVIQDVTFGKAVGRAWNDLWGKRGAFVFWLVLLLVSLVYSFALFLIIMLLTLPASALQMAGMLAWANVATFIADIIIAVPYAIFLTFTIAAWTLFFRRMTGMEPVAVYQAVAPQAGYYAQVPPVPAPPQEAPIRSIEDPAVGDAFPAADALDQGAAPAGSDTPPAE